MKFTKEQTELITGHSTMVCVGDTRYFHIPQWFKQTEDMADGVFEIVSKENLPLGAVYHNWMTEECKREMDQAERDDDGFGGTIKTPDQAAT